MEARNLTLREASIAAVGMVVLSALFCGPHLLLDPDLAPFDNGDSVGSYFPYFARTYQPLSPQIAGDWDPTLWTGLPESHSPFGRYYPPAWLLFVLFPLGLALSLTYVVHHALAGLGTYFLMRTQGFRPASAWLAGMVFAFGGFMLFHRPFVTILQTAAWLPWILWAFESFRRERTWIWIAVAGTLMALHALAAHTQTIVIGGLVWAPYAVYFTLFQRGSFAARSGFALGIALACALGVVGSLPQTLPMTEVAGWTPYAAPDFNYYKSGSFELRYLAGMAGPWTLGGAFGVPYACNDVASSDAGCASGVFGLALSIVGGCAAWRLLRRRDGATDAAAPAVARADVGFWLFLYVLHALLMLGRHSPLYAALFHVPVYNMFHVPARHLWVVSLAVAWFAALGLEQIRVAGAGVRFRIWRQTALGLALVALVCTIVVITSRAWPDKPGLGYPGFWVPLACGGAVLVLLALGLGSVRRRPLWIGLIVIAAFVELRLTLGGYFFSPMSASRAAGPEHFPDVVRALRAAQHGEAPTRCLIENGAWRSVTPKGEAPNAWGQMWAVSVLNCYSQSMPRSLAHLLHLDKYGLTHFNRVLAEERGLSAVGGRFIVVKRPPRPAAAGLGFVEVDCDDLWPDSGPLVFSSQPDKSSRLHTQTLLYAAAPYLLEGELIAKRRSDGSFRIKLIDFNKVVGEFTISSEQFIGDRCAFACFLEPLLARDLRSGVEIHLECSGNMMVELTSLNFWNLNERPGTTSADAVRRLTQRLRAGARSSYVPRADLAARVYENPHARGLATLVTEVRPAENDLAAARAIVETRSRPVRALAFVVAPQGDSQGLKLAGPRTFSPGIADVIKYRADDIRLQTQTDGEGFLVLAVTRCRGWTATVDGEPAPIHAVDGPLMGVRVPPGAHVIRFRFQPVLLHAGAQIAGTAFGLAWASVLIGIWMKKNRRQATRLPARPEIIPQRRMAA